MWDSEIKKNCVTVKTGITQQEGRIVLESVRGQLSDGIWENSPRMEGFWRFFCIDVDEAGEVCIYISREPRIWEKRYPGYKMIPNRFHGESDAWILNWFANKLAEIARIEAKDWAGSSFRMTKGNAAISRYLGDLHVLITGDTVWQLRKKLLEKAAETSC